MGHAGVALSSEREIYPDNSEASINYALKAFNADGVELDVQMTKDSVLVLYHNENITLQNGDVTCVHQLFWDEISVLNTQRNHPIIKLSDIALSVLESNKHLYLDLNFYDYCDSLSIDLGAMVFGLTTTFEDISNDHKQRLIFNARNMDLIELIPADLGLRSFETDKIDLGITYYEEGSIDIISTRVSTMNDQNQQKLKTKEIPFSLFSMKSRTSIREAAGFMPDYVITDNIPATRKFYN